MAQSVTQKLKTAMIGGATWSTTCIDKVHRSIIDDFSLNPSTGLGEIVFGAKCHRKI